MTDTTNSIPALGLGIVERIIGPAQGIAHTTIGFAVARNADTD